MRYAITTGIPHGTTVPQVITGPEVPLAEQKAAFLQMRALTEHPDFEAIQLWASDAGIIRKARFSKPAPKAVKAAKKPAPKAEESASKSAEKTGE